MSRSEQMQKMKSQPGFVAALDQSGGSTSHALALYGIKGHAWKDDDEARLSRQPGGRNGRSTAGPCAGWNYQTSLPRNPGRTSWPWAMP
jgi:fructose-bisphosphate aldolase class 1